MVTAKESCYPRCDVAVETLFEEQDGGLFSGVDLNGKNGFQESAVPYESREAASGAKLRQNFEAFIILICAALGMVQPF